MNWRSGRWRRHHRRDNVIELREILVEVRLPYGSDLRLVGRLSVAAENLLHHVHAGGDMTKRGKAHGIESGILTEADEKLGGASIRTSRRER